MAAGARATGQEEHASVAGTPPAATLAAMARKAGALQGLYTARAAATADLLVANHWSPLHGGYDDGDCGSGGISGVGSSGTN